MKGKRSREVEEQGFDGAGGLELEDAGVLGTDGIPWRQGHATDLHVTLDELEPKAAAGGEGVRDARGGGRLDPVDGRILADVSGAFATPTVPRM